MAMPFSIPGITPDAVKGTDTTAPVSAGKPFPFPLGTYENGVTGEASNLTVKTIGDSEYFSLMVSNNGHVAEILIDTDPRNTNPKSKLTADQQLQDNLTLLTRFIAHMGCMNARGQVDPSLFKAADGKLVTFTARNKASVSKRDGREYINTSGYYKGDAKALVPVIGIQATAPSATVSVGAYADDIPF